MQYLDFMKRKLQENNKSWVYLYSAFINQIQFLLDLELLILKKDKITYLFSLKY